MKKTFKTLEEQIKILESRGLIINDYDKTYDILFKENYFFINGYRHFLVKTDCPNQFKEGATFEELEHLTLGSLRKAVIDGDVVNGSLMAGQSAGMVKKEQTCEEIMQEIVKEAEQLMQH